MPEKATNPLLDASKRLAAHADLMDVRTFKLEAECTAVPSPNRRLGFEFSFDVLASELDDDALTVAYTCSVGLYLAATDDEDREELGQVLAIVGALYEVREPEGDVFSQSEIEAFSETVARLALFPYARAAVADLTGRLGLPHLHLPSMKIPVSAPGKKSTSKKRSRKQLAAK